MSSKLADRHWLDWSRPFLPAAASWLADHGCRRAEEAGEAGTCLLDGVMCVTPGRRAGRVLLDALLRECESRSPRVHLRPPGVITPGVLPEAICEPPEPRAVATREESRLAWAAALRAEDAASIAPLLPRPPAPADLLAWDALAQRIADLHEQLAGEMLGFSDVADRAARMEMFGESDRWAALAVLHRRYLSVLGKADLLDAHEARVEAIGGGRAANASQPQLDVVLVGIAELNRLQRAALGRGAASITALIHAPEADLTAAFDELGCVVPAFWAERAIELEEDQIVIADAPDDQAQAAMEWLAPRRGAAVDSITIGLADASLAEPLERAAKWAGVELHLAEARTLARTAPYKLLQAIAEWLREQRFAAFAALLRHADLERWLMSHRDMRERGVRDWISLLDEYFSDHLHARLTTPWLGEGERPRRLRQVHDAVRALAASLLTPPQARPLGEWCCAILEVLQRVYFNTENASDDSIDASLAMRDQLAAFAAVEPALQPECDAPAALELLLAACADGAIASPLRDEQIEALGWLELHLDAAPHVLVMGVNDGRLPQAFAADAFLPDSLRAALGLPCSASRYARDAYLLDAMTRSRRSGGRLALIAGRRGPEGDPLTPSRLLLACDPEHLPERVLRLSDEKRARRYSIPMGAPAAAPASGFTIFAPPPGPCAIEEMRVTSFRTFLQCPRRWWLRLVQGLCAVDDEGLELDPLGFGGLAHDVLEAFALDEAIRESIHAEPIAQWLSDRLGSITNARFGAQPPPAVRVQIDRLRRRFERFATFQARTRAEGWRIVESEVKIRGVPLDVPGQEPIRITGKIDRIDERRDGGVTRYRIIDYKTSEQPETPFQTHHGRKRCDPERWIDLQLPLYRLLAVHAGYGGDRGEVELGYIVLPRDVGRIGFLPAEWTRSEHEAAIECARDVVRRIRAGEFPMSDDVDGRYDDFANICQSSVRGRAALAAASAAAAEAQEEGES